MTSNSDHFPVCLHRANNAAICPFASHLIFVQNSQSALTHPFADQGEVSSRLGPDGCQEWRSDWPKHRPFTFRFLQNTASDCRPTPPRHRSRRRRPKRKGQKLSLPSCPLTISSAHHLRLSRLLLIIMRFSSPLTLIFPTAVPEQA